ncbi:MAG: hypothetical protein LUP95_03150 [Euryarchaeota archaeon]|nr:hypothetical protein [Euryarchaeota archaeon]
MTDLNTLRALTVMARDKMQIAITLFDRKPRERVWILADRCVNIACRAMPQRARELARFARHTILRNIENE